MSFTTLKFIVFFAAVFFGYYCCPKKLQPWILLLASYVFYMMAAPIFVVYLLLTTAVTFGGALWMQSNLSRQKDWIKANGKMVSREVKSAYKQREQGKRRGVLVCVIVLVLGLLMLFKYGDFFLKNVSWLMGTFGRTHEFTALNLILPIGLSFYVFQSLGYCIDVYREEILAERNPLKYALFVSYFPQVLQGPIGNFERLMPQLGAAHDFDQRQVVPGLQRVVWGFFKKLVVANRIAQCIDPAWVNVSGYQGALSWLLIAMLYSFQLYADFSGYMDIACGCSQMLGIRLDENFESPYLTKSIAEFWRKWHITLGVWFKNYLFYPLLRSKWNMSLRKSLGSGCFANVIPTVVALFVVWALIGLWHGADWSYVVYGLYHGFFVILSVVLAGFYDKVHAAMPHLIQGRAYRVFQIVRTFLIVSIGYLIFKPANLDKTLSILASSMELNWQGAVSMISGNCDVWVSCAALSLFLLVVDCVHLKCGCGALRTFISRRPRILRIALYLLFVELILSLGLLDTQFQVFEYFKF